MKGWNRMSRIALWEGTQMDAPTGMVSRRMDG